MARKHGFWRVVPRGFPTAALSQGVGVSLNRYSNANPLYIAHRGGSWLAPEETFEAYDRALSLGAVAMEQDVRALSDAALGLMHDSTVDRTTTSSGNVVSLNTAGFAALAIDAAAQNIPGYGDAVQPRLLPEVLSRYRGRTIFVPEAKVTGVKQTLVDALVAAGIPTDQALVQVGTAGDAAPAITAGYPVCYVGSTTDTEIATIQGAGITWAALSDTASDAVILAWVAAGFKILIYTPNRRFRRKQLLALGVVGFFADDPIYMAGNVPRSTLLDFADGKWPVGMIPTRDNRLVTSSGAIGSGEWGWATANSTNADFVIPGDLCPLDLSSSSWTVEFEMKPTQYNGGDTSRWLGGAIADAALMEDMKWGEGLTTDKGYRFLLSGAGTLQLSRRDGASTTSLQSKSITAPTIDVYQPFRLASTPSAITFSLLNGDGSVNQFVTSSDTTYRGGYIHLGRSGAGGMFRNIRKVA